MDEQCLEKVAGEHWPLVSVIIPAYNAERFISRTLESVLAQTYPKFELLVVDDGCQDGTAAIVRQYMQRDNRIQLLQQPNAGVAAARNLGIDRSRGELIAPLDADDIWFPENIEKQVKQILSADKKVGLIYSWSIDIDEYDQPTGDARKSHIEGNVLTTLLIHDFIANASCVLIRKSCLDRVGSYDVTLRERHGQGGEDWDIYLRISERYDFQVVPKLLVGYRKVSGSMSTDSSQMARSRHLIWQKLYQEYPKIPPLIKQLSNSSFYLHLANQNYQECKNKAAIEWAIKALQASPVTTLLSPSLYRVFIAASLRIWFPESRSSVSPKAALTLSRNRKTEGKKQPRKRQVHSSWQFKNIGETVIHIVASSFFGRPDQWL